MDAYRTRLNYFMTGLICGLLVMGLITLVFVMLLPKGWCIP